MHPHLASMLLGICASLFILTLPWVGSASFAAVHEERTVLQHASPRSTPVCFPRTPTKSLPIHGPRNRTCPVQSHNDGLSDDSTYLLDALHSCNDGGTVVFQKEFKYFIGTALDLTFLRHVDIGMFLFGQEKYQAKDIDIQSYVQFSNDTKYWQSHSFPFIFQNVTSFFKLGGSDVNIYGGGTIDGNGQVWYDLYASNIHTLRPVLFGIDDLHNSTISNLVLRYSPQYYHFVANSSNVIFDNINIAGASKNKHPAKNTDGWDLYRSSDIVIQNSVVNNGDDCVSFKPNSTNILVQNMFCNGSHGISVGSLGQYVGEYDIVENIYVFNISMHNATDGARIKVWPNTPSALSGDLQGGGGNGRVNNITYDTMTIDNVDYAIEINQCYGQENKTLCLQYPSPLTITDIVFKNFKGRTSKKHEPNIATFSCSSPTSCNNIVASAIDVISPKGKATAYCLNVNSAALNVTCSTKK